MLVLLVLGKQKFASVIRLFRGIYSVSNSGTANM